MPGKAQTDWYLLVLIAGTAVVAFVLGSAVTLWLGPAVGARDQSALGRLGPGTIVASQAGVAGAGPLRASNTDITSSKSQSVSSLMQPARSLASGRSVVSPESRQPIAGPAPAGQSAAAMMAAASQASQSAETKPEAGGASAALGAIQPARFSLQLGAFLEAANAKSLSGKLAAQGYAPISVDSPDGYGHVWHYVRLGAFADDHAAALSASELLEQTGIGAAIVRGSAASAGG
jgi:cell division septation protein DedD